MVKFTGLSYFTKSEKKYIKSLTQFINDKFFTKRLQDKLDIEINFKKNLIDKEGVAGDCVGLDDHFRPKQFVVRIDSKMKFNRVLNTLAHELVHAKQWAKGEMYEMLKKKNVVKFNKKEYNSEKINYWELPWEIEAYGRAPGLVNQWAHINKLNGKECDKVIYEG
jgi:hypothetical protein